MPTAGGGSVVKRVRKPVDRAVMDLSAPFPESHRGIVCCICSERCEKLVINTPEAAGGRHCRFSCMAWVSVHGTNDLTWDLNAYIFFETHDESLHTRCAAPHLTLYP